MTLRRLPCFSCSVVVLSILSAPALGANTPISVDVERAVDTAYTVDAAFDVNVPASLAWDVLTDYEGIGRSAIKGSVKTLLDEIRQEMLARGAR